MRYTFNNPDAPTTRHAQYYSMLGSRSIYQDGWKAVARHGALANTGNFLDDEWELYHYEVDRSENHNLAEQNPDKLKTLIGTWIAYAGRNFGFPLDDRSPVDILNDLRPEISKPRNSYIYYPNTSPISESVAPNTRNRSFSILANVEIDTPEAEGVLLSFGSQFGGHSLFVKGGRLYYVNNFLGITEQKVVSDEQVPTGKSVLGMEFTKEKEEPRGVANGVARLYINDKVVGEGQMKTQPGGLGLAAMLIVGRSGPDPVSNEYQAPFAFRGGTIERVSINLTGAHYVDEEVEAKAMLARE
jgi:arylsulfatase